MCLIYYLVRNGLAKKIRLMKDSVAGRAVSEALPRAFENLREVAKNAEVIFRCPSDGSLKFKSLSLVNCLFHW